MSSSSPRDKKKRAFFVARVFLKSRSLQLLNRACRVVPNDGPRRANRSFFTTLRRSAFSSRVVGFGVEAELGHLDGEARVFGLLQEGHAADVVVEDVR